MANLSLERWREVDTLFGQALERPVDERTAFLRSACGSDRELYEEVSKLLAASDEAESAIGDSVKDFAAPLLADMESERDRPPDRLGPYRIISELGRGGMGTVYLAERDDGQFKRDVAIKLVKRGMDSDEIVNRFRHERQILASLQHEGIARMYGGGLSPDGRPYLVLEYVKGTPITDYCRDRSLSASERLDLFEQVADAVQYAHQNLVVHRDLKPSNILVTEDGKVRLLDFGIAKLISDDAELVTRTGIQIMTPEYAAPEQRVGATITTATDVYALGIVLGEMLAGERPTVEASTTRTNLTGDLDTIVRKALRAEPERRYASAEAMVGDIRNFRSGRPVTARPDTMGYRLAKYGARHRVALGIVAASTALLIGVSAFYAARIVDERNTALRERDKAEEVASFLEELFDASDPFAPDRMDTLQVRGFLERGTRQMDTELADQPLVRAQMQTVMGRVYNRLDLRDEAYPLLRSALKTRVEHLGPDHPDVGETMLELADVEYSEGNYAAADSLSAAALEIGRSAYGERSRPVSDAMSLHAMTLHAEGALDSAEALYRQDLALKRELYGDPHPETAIALSTLAWLLSDQGAAEESEQLYRESVAMRREVYPAGHPSIAVGLNNLGVLLRDEGRYDEAEELLRAALAINRETLGPNHEHVIDNLNILASILRGQGKNEEAVPVYQDVLDARLASLGPDHPRVSITLDGYAGVLKELGEFERAEELELEAIAVARRAFGDEHFAISITTGRLADIILAAGEPERALPHYRSALELAERLFEPDHFRIASLKSRLGGCLVALERYSEAELLLVDAVDSLTASQGEASRYTQGAINNAIDLYERWGKDDEANRYRSMRSEPMGE